jgi:hypothetical protein
MSPLSKFVHAREMNYYGNILKSGQEPAWDGLAAYLARAQHDDVTSVTLYLSGALVPPVEDHQVPARPYLEFDPPTPIYEWKP